MAVLPDYLAETVSKIGQVEVGFYGFDFLLHHEEFSLNVMCSEDGFNQLHLVLTNYDLHE